MTGYTEIIRHWATDTRRAGLLEDADGTGEVGLESNEAGSRLAIRFTMNVNLNRVTDVRYQVFGCGFTIAACAVAADLAVGYTLDDIQTIDSRQLDQALEGLPEERSYCADLAAEALHSAARSARNGRQPVQSNIQPHNDHGPRITVEDAVYSALINTPQPHNVSEEDRHLFACLLAVASQDPWETGIALGLKDHELARIISDYFPQADPSLLKKNTESTTAPPLEGNNEVLAILLSHVPKPFCKNHSTGLMLAHILATRAVLPGHLWVAMGLFERSQLTKAIQRHLPSLAAANHQNMRWKRYLFKQVCESNGGVMCKAPNCGECSDYATCFADD